MIQYDEVEETRKVKILKQSPVIVVEKHIIMLMIRLKNIMLIILFIFEKSLDIVQMLEIMKRFL